MGRTLLAMALALALELLEAHWVAEVVQVAARQVAEVAARQVGVAGGGLAGQVGGVFAALEPLWFDHFVATKVGCGKSPPSRRFVA